MIDLTNLTGPQLRLLVGKRGMPKTWDEIFDLQQEQRREAAKAAARSEDEAGAAKAEANRLSAGTARQQALDNLPKFDAILDQLLGLSTSGNPEHGLAPVDGPVVAALLMTTKAWCDGEFARIRAGLRERLRDLATEYDWNLEHLVNRFMEGRADAVAGEVAWSQGLNLTLEANPTLTEADASDLLNKSVLGYKIPLQSRSRSDAPGATERRRNRKKKKGR